MCAHIVFAWVKERKKLTRKKMGCFLSNTIKRSGVAVENRN